MNGYDFTATSKSRGCGDSATRPDTVEMLLCRQLRFLSLLQNSHEVSLTSQQPALQKLVPKCQKIPTERGSKSASPGQSCRMSIFSHPVQCNMVQFYTSDAVLTPNNKSQELWSMGKGKPQRKQRKTLGL